jgi:poly(A) polymerase/tRNA nucleotidyltransferase (CCA-adding enzyme)
MKALGALRLLEKRTDAEVFLVGGFVRDFLRRRKNNDVDVVVRNISLEAAMAFLKGYGKCKIVSLSQARDIQLRTLLFRSHREPEVEVQISLPRRGKLQIADKTNSLKQDSKYRDFKINALYLPVFFKSKRDVIDLVGGIKDIKDRTITPITTAEECIMLSPIRMLRTVRLAATTNYRISEDLISEIRHRADKILTVPPEVIRSEFNKILMAPRPSRYLRLLQRMRLLKYFLPELDRCVGVKQDERYHKYDVFSHSVFTVDFLEPNLVLRLAGLLHDVGKTDTRQEVKAGKEKHVTFHKHEIESVKLARGFLDRLRYDNKTKFEVLGLIRMHMYHYTREYTDAAVRRFIKRAGITRHNVGNIHNHLLFKLRAGERQGNGLKKDPVTQRQRDFENRILEIFNKGAAIEMSELDINGHVIIEAFNIKPGPFVGEVLEHLVECVRENKLLNNRLDLLDLALKFIKGQRAPGREDLESHERGDKQTSPDFQTTEFQVKVR